MLDCLGNFGAQRRPAPPNGSHGPPIVRAGRLLPRMVRPFTAGLRGPGTSSSRGRMDRAVALGKDSFRHAGTRERPPRWAGPAASSPQDRRRPHNATATEIVPCLPCFFPTRIVTKRKPAAAAATADSHPCHEGFIPYRKVTAAEIG